MRSDKEMKVFQSTSEIFSKMAETLDRIPKPMIPKAGSPFLSPFKELLKKDGGHLAPLGNAIRVWCFTGFRADDKVVRDFFYPLRDFVYKHQDPSYYSEAPTLNPEASIFPKPVSLKPRILVHSFRPETPST